MSQNKWIPQDVYFYIYEMAFSPELVRKYRSRSALARAIRSKLKEKEKRVPSQATVEKKISEYYKSDPHYKDRCWSLLEIERYPITPDALPIVLKLWAYEQKNYHRRMDIREAVWGARIYGIFKQAGLDEDKPGLISTLAGYARTLSHAEKFLEETRDRNIKPDDICGWEIEIELLKFVLGVDSDLVEEIRRLDAEGKINDA